MYNYIIKQVHPDIPTDCFTCVVNVMANGFCGFRALTSQLYDGREDMFWDVKLKVRDVLLKNERYYKNTFADFMEYDESKRRVCYGIEEKIGSQLIADNIVGAPEVYYFSIPGCAQLAADTFGRPVATYVEQQFSKNSPGTTFFPFLNKMEFQKEKKKPMLLIMQRVNGNHFVTFIMRRSVKMVWPLPSPSMYSYACSSLGRSDNIKATFWNTYLIFKQRKNIIQECEPSVL